MRASDELFLGYYNLETPLANLREYVSEDLTRWYAPYQPYAHRWGQGAYPAPCLPSEPLVTERRENGIRKLSTKSIS